MKKINVVQAIRIILEVIAVIVVVFFFFRHIQNSKVIAALNGDKKKVEKEIKTEAKELQRKVDDKGVETVLFDVTGNKATTDQVASGTRTKGLIDTTAMALDIRTKQLKEILVVKGTLEAENIKLKQQLNEAHHPYYTYSGNGLNLKFTPPNDTDSVASADFTANVNLKATQYWKRNWFLGAKKSILAVSSDNPMFKINGADFVEFEQKQPSFGLRLQARTALSPLTGMIGYGPAARVDLGRFSFQGNYMYYPSTSTWRPSIIGTYDIIRF